MVPSHREFMRNGDLQTNRCEENMGFIFEERLTDSPYIETITHGRTAGSGTTIRPAMSNWHMVLVKYNGNVQFITTGPLTTAGELPYIDGLELLCIKLKLGGFMPHLPT